MMASLDSSSERSILESLVPTLQAEGYHVLVQPPPFVLPPFMGSYRPDAVALKPGKNIAIEVVSPVRPGTGKTKSFRSFFAASRLGIPNSLCAVKQCRSGNRGGDQGKH